MPTPNTFDFNPDVQQKTLALLLYHPDLLGDKVAAVRPELFEHDALKAMVVIVHRYRAKHPLPMPEGEFDEEFRQLLEKDIRLPSEEFFRIRALVGLKQTEDFGWVVERVMDFVRMRTAEILVSDWAEDLKKAKQSGRSPHYEAFAERTTQLTTRAAAADEWEVESVCAADVQEEQIEWLWRDVFPKGMLSVIMGPPGMGKSYFATMVAARISTGVPWPTPNTPPPQQGHVMILQAEDDMRTTYKRRLRHEAADQRYIHCLKAMKNTAGERRTVDLTGDVERVRRKMHEVGDVRLLVVDPLSAYVGLSTRMDSHKERDVRLALAPLERMMEEERVPVIGIMHLNKNQMADALYRISGSAAWAQVPRMIWTVTKRRDDPELKEFLNAKHNPVPQADALAQQFCFRIPRDTNRITLEANEQPGDVGEALAAAGPEDATDRRSKMKMALEVLEGLKAGPDLEVPAAMMEEQFAEMGIRSNTWVGARKQLGIKSYKRPDGSWYWILR